jgi:signal transduction histidine kinase
MSAPEPRRARRIADISLSWREQSPPTDLALALEKLSEEFMAADLDVTQSAGLHTDPTPAVTQTLVEAIRVALCNVISHADTSTVVVRAQSSSGRLVVTVRDQGRGFNPKMTTYGGGLDSVNGALHALGGGIEVWSQPGRGTKVTFWVPIA